MKSSRARFVESLAHELLASADRVRDLIGDKHWLSDGTQKEGLLSTLITRALPSGTQASKGFVLSANDDGVCSKEIDILVLNTSAVGPFFHEHDILMGMPAQALAAVSVKTRFAKEALRSVFKNLCSIHKVASVDTPPGRTWTSGFFFFDDASDTQPPDPSRVLRTLRDVLVEQSPHAGKNLDNPRLIGPDLLAVGKDLCIAIDYDAPEAPSIRAFSCKGLAFGAFVASLLDHVAAVRDKAAHPLAKCIDELDFALISEE